MVRAARTTSSGRASARASRSLSSFSRYAGGIRATMPMSSSTSRPSSVTQHVAGMRVGVEDAVDQHVVQIDPEELVGELGTVELEPAQRSDVGHLPPRHELHGQHAARGEVGVRMRDDDPFVVREHPADGGEVLGLPSVVQLVHQGAPELLEQLAEAVAAPELGVVVDQPGHLAQHLHVFEGLLADAWPLHLHHHVAPVAQRCPVHLAQRGRGQRCLVEAREQRRETDAELGAHEALDLVVRERRDVVLEA